MLRLVYWGSNKDTPSSNTKIFLFLKINKIYTTFVWQWMNVSLSLSLCQRKKKSSSILVHPPLTPSKWRPSWIAGSRHWNEMRIFFLSPLSQSRVKKGKVYFMREKHTWHSFCRNAIYFFETDRKREMCQKAGGRAERTEANPKGLTETRVPACASRCWIPWIFHFSQTRTPIHSPCLCAHTLYQHLSHTLLSEARNEDLLSSFALENRGCHETQGWHCSHPTIQWGKQSPTGVTHHAEECVMFILLSSLYLFVALTHLKFRQGGRQIHLQPALRRFTTFEREKMVLKNAFIYLLI